MPENVYSDDLSNFVKLLNDSFNTYYQLDSSEIKWPSFWHSITHLALFCLLVLAIIIYSLFLKSKGREKSLITGSNFHYMDTEFNNLAVNSLKRNVGYYIPPWWYHPLLGTIIPFGNEHSLKFERELLSSPDSDFFVDWFPHKPYPKHKDETDNPKIILFLPGLGIDSKNKICKRFVQVVSSMGFYCGIVNPRGVDLPLKTPKLWYPGLYEDCETTVSKIESLLPKANVFLVGFSSGTQIIQRTLLHRQKHGKSCQIIKGVMNVCVLQDYTRVRNKLETTSLGRFFSKQIAKSFKDMFRKYRELLEDHHIHDPTIIERTLNTTYVSELDPYSAQIYGYSHVNEYYEALSCINYDHVHIPMLLVQPTDDPLHSGVPHHTLDINKYTDNPHIIYYQPEYGNHFGFYEGPLYQAFSNEDCYTYPPKLAVDFFNMILKHDNSEKEKKQINHMNISTECSTKTMSTASISTSSSTSDME